MALAPIFFWRELVPHYYTICSVNSVKISLVMRVQTQTEVEDDRNFVIRQRCLKTFIDILFIL